MLKLIINDKMVIVILGKLIHSCVSNFLLSVITILSKKVQQNK
jgi:hypothetical protein